MTFQITPENRVAMELLILLIFAVGALWVERASVRAELAKDPKKAVRQEPLIGG